MMKEKKSKSANLENKKGIFFQIGLLVSMAVVLYAFTYSSEVEAGTTLGTLETEVFVEEDMPIVSSSTPPPPPPPPPKQVEIIDIVPDDELINDELELFSSEADNTTEIPVAQVIEEKEELVKEQEIVLFAEEMPEFPGGNTALIKWLGRNVKYPVVAQENGLQGKVYVNFVVDTDGSISNARIARGVAPSLDKEALRVIQSMPKWKPGKQGGEKVRVSYTAPINFKLQ